MSKEPEVGRKCSAVLGRLPPHRCCYPQPSADFHDKISAFFLSDKPVQPRRLRRCACQCVQILEGQVWRTAPGDFLDPQHPLSVWRFHILLLKLSKYFVCVLMYREVSPLICKALICDSPQISPRMIKPWIGLRNCIRCFAAASFQNIFSPRIF